MSAAIRNQPPSQPAHVTGIVQSSESDGPLPGRYPSARNREIASHGPVNDDLVRAIADKRLVEFVYKAGRTRIVEPHDYGIRRDVERLLGFQIGGESQSGASHGWKEFDVDQIRYLRVLDRRFAGTRADSAQHHRTWDTLFARVT